MGGYRKDVRLASLLIIVLFWGYGTCQMYRKGLNKWFFQRMTELDQHELYSTLLCPNPMTDARMNSNDENDYGRFQIGNMALLTHENTLAPIDVWSMQTDYEVNLLPCSLKKYSSGSRPQESKLKRDLLMFNVSKEPFTFPKASTCNAFIKLSWDDINGAELVCKESLSKDTLEVEQDDNNFISWPKDRSYQKISFSLFKSLKRFTVDEERLRTKFYFQVFISLGTGESRKCIVQQYELNLRKPGCDTQNPKFISDVCGVYDCKEEIFSHVFQKISSSTNEVSTHRGPFKPYASIVLLSSRSENIKLILFLTVLGLLLLGICVFGLQITIYLGCQRKTVNKSNGHDSRSQQILQNSINLWESMPTRESRSVSFSPVPTNIDTLANVEVHSSYENPKILKSALKRKSGSDIDSNLGGEYVMERPPEYNEAIKS